MKKSIVLSAIAGIFLAVMVSRPAPVLSFGGCEEDCQKCHTLEKKEAEAILAKLKSPAKVLSVGMSPIRGLWQISVEDGGRRGVLYVGFSKKYVVGGSIIEVETSQNMTRETVEDMNRASTKPVDVAKIPAEHSLVMGDRNAPNRVFVFTDPDCPYCSRLHAELKKVLAEEKDISFYLKLMPLKMHPDAYWKAQSILCSGSLGLLEENFEKRPIPKPACGSSAVDENIKLGSELGITGTPTLVMPDGTLVFGFKDAETIRRLVMTHQKGGAS